MAHRMVAIGQCLSHMSWLKKGSEHEAISSALKKMCARMYASFLRGSLKSKNYSYLVSRKRSKTFPRIRIQTLSSSLP